MIIKSLMDNDLYKFTMLQGYYVLNLLNTDAEYKFVDRDDTVYTKEQFNKIKKEIKKLSKLRFTKKELDYLYSIKSENNKSKMVRLFKKDFVYKYLKDFKLDKDMVLFDYNNGRMKIRFKGKLPIVSMYEIFVLAIVSEVMSSYKEDASLMTGALNLKSQISSIPEGEGYNLIDFGTRRRYSFLWQDEVVSYLKKQSFFMGTSNVYLAMKHDVKPVGTMAHEWFQIHQGFFSIKESQYRALENWDRIYPDGLLGIALTDIFDMNTFMKDFKRNKKFYDVFKGLRHDSGEPVEWGKKAINLFKESPVNAKKQKRTLTFSDGLDVEKSLVIMKQVKEYVSEYEIEFGVLYVFGIGTKLTNNMGAKAPNIVIKNVVTNGKSTAKISDEPGKSVCEDDEYIEEVKNKMKNW